MKNQQTKSQQIGAKIKLERNAQGMSQAKLAEEIGFESAVAISLIENGERTITIEKLEKIGEVLHKDIKYFLGDEDAPVKIEVALRAQKDLDIEDQDAILRFIELAKSKYAGRKQ